MKDVKRQSLLQRMWDLGREMSTQTVFLHQAIAQSAGLNATDTKCIDLILRSGESPVTAGWLSQQSGLTTGAITHILDRLEKRAFIERVHDKADRRRVLIKANHEQLKPLFPKYEAIGTAYMALLEDYTTAELELILGYLEKALEISRQQISKIAASGEKKPAKSQ